MARSNFHQLWDAAISNILTWEVTKGEVNRADYAW